MRKSLVLLVSGLVVLGACKQNKDVNSTKKAQADSLKTDSDRHDKLVIALAKDTNRHNYTDANGKKQGYWIITNRMRNLPGYDSNARIEEGEYYNNMREGEWIEYNADGSVKSRTTFKDDQPIR